MEVRSDLGIMAGREQYSVGLQKSPLQPQTMQLSFNPDGAPIYKPVTSGSTVYQAAGVGAGGVGDIGEDAAQAVAPYRLNMNVGEPIKRKRGRPRKYGPEGSMALELGSLSSPMGASGSSGFPSTAAGSSSNPASSPSSASASVTKKARGRPPGSGKKQQLAALGSAGIGFTPHVITVKAGEDVSSKIMSFSQHGPRAVCILSATGAISNVTLRQAATSGGTVTYEGRFEILSLSGSFLLSESGGQRGRTGGLSVSLAGPDGRLLGGGVAGLLTAASPVQVVVGSFIIDGRREPQQVKPQEPTPSLAEMAPRPVAGGGGSAAGEPLHTVAGMADHGGDQQGLPSVQWT
ncbi:unnamed protein product [Spirodela intermedia]|uniref:AT-hook motif nuclear-localized protein n=1 Tax=Spirodela intermedia TaxID=51605 RepID=A0A7I8LAZ8_SPIIN|nr:unnamed protein product [Spirodela intermedia]